MKTIPSFKTALLKLAPPHYSFSFFNYQLQKGNRAGGVYSSKWNT